MAKYGHNRSKKGTPGWNSVDSTTVANTNPMERVSLNPEKFDILLSQQGVEVCVYRSAFCPRVKSVDGAEHDIDCPVCKGTDMIDLYPLTTKCFIQSQTFQHINGADGFSDGNHVTATFPIGIELSYFTLVELKNFTDIYYERIMRAPNTSEDVLQYCARNVNFLIDYSGKQYNFGSDFTISPSGNIKWATGKAPADYTVYSIHYEIPVRFRAIQALHVNRFAQVKKITDIDAELLKMPEQWILAKEFLVARSNKRGQRLRKGPFDNHTIVEDDGSED